MIKYNPTDDTDHLKWLHIMISNIKATIEGAYHGIYNKYIQCYLDEFSYRFNRRFSKKPMLDHLLECCVRAPYKKFAELCI